MRDGTQHQHLGSCLDAYKLFLHPDLMKVVIAPACVRTWECPAHTGRELVSRIAPLYLPEYTAEPWHAPTLHVAEPNGPTALRRYQRQASAKNGMYFTIAVKYGRNVFACTEPVGDSSAKVTTARWLHDVVVIGRNRQIVRINGLDKWAIPQPESDWMPVNGECKSHAEAQRISKLAMSKAKRNKWSDERTRQWLAEEMGEDFIWPDLTTDEVGVA